MYLSILIPVFNAENHIINCLQSILKQEINSEDYEVLIINDGSTDESSRLIADFVKDKPNMQLFDQNNKGNAATRNSLVEMAQGTYVYCLDADDYLIPGALKKVLDFALNNEMDFVGFHSSETLRPDENKLSSDHLNDAILISTGVEFLKEKSLPYVEVWWYLVSKKLLKDFQIGLDNITMADVIFTYKIVLSSRRMCVLPLQVHWYFQSPVSIMRTKGSIAEHKLRLADATYEMVLRLNDLIEKPEEFTLDTNVDVKKDLILKRDYYSFFMIIKWLRFSRNSQKIKDKITILEQRSMYPFTSHVQIHKIPYFFEKIINSVINTKRIVFALIWISSIFKHKK